MRAVDILSLQEGDIIEVKIKRIGRKAKVLHVYDDKHVTYVYVEVLDSGVRMKAFPIDIITKQVRETRSFTSDDKFKQVKTARKIATKIAKERNKDTFVEGSKENKEFYCLQCENIFSHCNVIPIKCKCGSMMVCKVNSTAYKRIVINKVR